MFFRPGHRAGRRCLCRRTARPPQASSGSFGLRVGADFSKENASAPAIRPEVFASEVCAPGAHGCRAHFHCSCWDWWRETAAFVHRSCDAVWRNARITQDRSPRFGSHRAQNSRSCNHNSEESPRQLVIINVLTEPSRKVDADERRHRRAAAKGRIAAADSRIARRRRRDVGTDTIARFLAELEGDQPPQRSAKRSGRRRPGSPPIPPRSVYTPPPVPPTAQAMSQRSAHAHAARGSPTLAIFDQPTSQ